MRRSSRSFRRVVPLVAVAGALLACDRTEPRGPGAIRINATASSQEGTYFEYGVAIDYGTPWKAYVGEPLTILQVGLSHGEHSITVSGAPATCTGLEPRTATLAGDDTVVVNVTIACPRTTGDLKVNVTTTGSDFDANGYLVRLNGITRGFVSAGASATTTIFYVTPGSQEVTLSDVATNCTLASAQNVIVTAGALATVNLSITCSPVAVLRFVASASGPDRDPDGYSILVDSVPVATVLQSQSINVRLTPGLKNWAVRDIQPNCAMGGATSGSATLAAADTVTIQLTATCAAIPMGAVGTAANDPPGDTLTYSGTNAQHDVLGVTARYATDWLILVVRFAKPVISNSTFETKALYGFIEFDVDESTATGIPAASNVYGANASIGVDYVFSFLNDSVSGTLARRVSGGSVSAGRVRTVFEGDSVIVQIPRVKFGADDGNMAIVTTLGTQERPNDVAPNAGAILARVPSAGAPGVTAPARIELNGMPQPLLMPQPGQPWWGAWIALSRP